jgi:hypothetical protein
MKFKLSRQIFEKVSDIKFHQNPYSGSRVAACGQTDMTKIIVALLYFANAPKNQSVKAVCFQIHVKYTLRAKGRIFMPDFKIVESFVMQQLEFH